MGPDASEDRGTNDPGPDPAEEPARPGRLRARIDALARRVAIVDVAIAVQRRFGEVQAGTLGSAITLTAFVSLIPLLVATSAVLGWLSVASDDLTDRVIDGLGLTGSAAAEVERALASAERSRRVATVLGVAGLLWSGMAIVTVLQTAYDRIWQVQGRGWKARPAALGWLVGAGLVFGVSIGGSAVLHALPWAFAIPGTAFGLATGFALFLWTAAVLPNRRVPLRALVPGALLGAVAFEVLKIAGRVVVPRLVESSSATYGTIGTVFAILAWMAILGRIVCYVAVTDVVLWERRHGTQAAPLTVPALDGTVPVEANRSGQVRRDRTDADPEAGV